MAKRFRRRAIIPPCLNRFTWKCDHCMIIICLHANTLTPCQSLANSNGFADICEKLHSDLYVLFLVTAAMFFDGSKIPTSVLWRTLKRTLVLSLVKIYLVLSENWEFRKIVTDDGRQVMAIVRMALLGWWADKLIFKFYIRYLIYHCPNRDIPRIWWCWTIERRHRTEIRRVYGLCISKECSFNERMSTIKFVHES